ncbi:MAG: LysR family transcriptional regulator [Steroidobacteraceae bacterium]
MAYSLIADDMAVFAKVVEANGFTAASRVLSVPKVTVSRAVARLERSVGTRLLERTTRRIALTTQGRAILAHCQQVLLAMESARAALAPPPAEARLRVGLDSAYGRLLVAPLMPRFLERFPGIALEVAAQDEGHFDVVLRADGRLEPGEAEYALGTPALIVCATPAYLAGKPLPVFPSDLAGHALLGSFGAGEPQLRLSKDGGTVVLRVAPRLNTSDASAVHNAAAAGLGIAVLPEFLCRNGLATKRLTRLLADWSVLDGPTLTAVSPAERARSPEVRSFVEFLGANLVPALAGANPSSG